MENSVLYLSQVEGIDAIMFGHAHKTFPSAEFKGKKGVDLEKGTINGVPSVEPGYWGTISASSIWTLKRWTANGRSSIPKPKPAPYTT